MTCHIENSDTAFGYFKEYLKKASARNEGGCLKWCNVDLGICYMGYFLTPNTIFFTPFPFISFNVDDEDVFNNQKLFTSLLFPLFLC